MQVNSNKVRYSVRRPTVCSCTAVGFKERLEAVYPAAKAGEHRVLVYVRMHRTIGIVDRSPQESVNLDLYCSWRGPRLVAVVSDAYKVMEVISTAISWSHCYRFPAMDEGTPIVYYVA